MLPLRFVGLSVILFLVSQAWCKPAKGNDGFEYNDDTPIEYDDDTVDDEEEDTVEGPPPQILSAPQSIHAREGSTVWLPCLLKNADSFAVTWNKDDRNLYLDSSAINADTNRTTRLPNNTLVIYNVTKNDSSDNYECRILTKPTITIRHRLLVDSEAAAPVTQTSTPEHKQPLIRVIPSRSVEVDGGQNITLGCETRIQPTPEIKWYHENKRVRSNVIVSGNFITITNVNRHDAGRYQCLVENGSENPPVGAINLHVYYAPEIETKGKWVHTGLGEESLLTCVVHANPRAKVGWFKNQKEILPKPGSIEITTEKLHHHLEILHTEKEHLGNYTCVAFNKLGQADKTISLTGIPSQAIISGGQMTKTANGLILKWQLESYSPITEYRLQYRRKGDENWTVLKPTVTNGKGNQYVVEQTIEGLQPGSYEAILMARNDFGWSSPSKPHMFVGEYGDEQAAHVKGSSASTSRPALAIATLFLVVTSSAFVTSL